LSNKIFVFVQKKMGVPSFYIWINKAFQYLTKRCLEDEKKEFSEINTEDENPNGEYDNLYLDTNGIIHPCCHPESGDQPETEEEMFDLIFLFIERLFRLVRPRKLLFIAIDGTAPRAKMNQQRSRRFRSIQMLESTREFESAQRKRLEECGIELPEESIPWDSNVITYLFLFIKTWNKVYE
jgi:5'-3' exoribonuclease 2